MAALKNVYQGGQIEYYNVWIDETQAPIKKAYARVTNDLRSLYLPGANTPAGVRSGTYLPERHQAELPGWSRHR